MSANLRSQIRMSDAERQAFLEEGHTAALATHAKDGTIQLVAMFYGILEGSIAFLTKAKSQKVQNLRRDPRATCLLEAGESYGELRGVSLVGHVEVIDAPERIRALAADFLSRRFGSFDDERLEGAVHNRVALKLIVERSVSWDHRKLA